MANASARTQDGFRFRGRYADADLRAMADCIVGQLMGKRIGGYTALGAGSELLIAVFLQSWTVAIAGFLAVIGASLLLRYRLLPARLQKLMRARPDLQQERTLTLGPTEIRDEAGAMRKILARKDLQRAILGRTHLFLVFRPHELVMLPLAWIPPEVRLEDVAQVLARK